MRRVSTVFSPVVFTSHRRLRSLLRPVDLILIPFLFLGSLFLLLASSNSPLLLVFFFVRFLALHFALPTALIFLLGFLSLLYLYIASRSVLLRVFALADPSNSF